jgi:hypothetical protein
VTISNIEPQLDEIDEPEVSPAVLEQGNLSLTDLVTPNSPEQVSIEIEAKVCDD